MKKVFLLAGCLSLLAVGIIGVSCSKDEEWKGCRCTFEFDGEKETETITAAEAKEEGWNSCAEAQKAFREALDSATCSDL